ncbi:MAG: alkaline phosphatase family protein [Candidatus Cloacimonetes bacterium]|nr:alkaline phosphatase family protein [Candidatus Cloacimonadota bacterium]
MIKYEVVFPDYTNCIINLMSSILQNYNVQIEHPSLKQLNISELKSKKNIILMIFDGYGYNLLKKYSQTSSSFLTEHLVDSITSVFPSTTTSVITSFRTAKTPLEHGALGWTMFFKEYYKFIDFLPNWDSITGKAIDHKRYRTYEKMKFENIFQKIHQADPSVELYNIYAKYLSQKPYSEIVSLPSTIKSYKSTKQLFNTVEKIVKKKSTSRKFIMSYSANPDGLEHKNGIHSKIVEDYLKEIDIACEKLTHKLKGTNTSILITADHGLVDVNKYFYANEDEELFDCLILPTMPEPRFISFFVKKHKFDKFQDVIQKYKDKFLILTRDEFLAKGFLGKGKMHQRIDDMLGDFVGIATSDAAIKTVFEQNGKWEKEFLAHHSGLTSDEMMVPLIKINV